MPSDILMLVRKDPVKFQRAVDLLGKWDDIKKSTTKSDLKVE